MHHISGGSFLLTFFSVFTSLFCRNYHSFTFVSGRERLKRKRRETDFEEAERVAHRTWTHGLRKPCLNISLSTQLDKRALHQTRHTPTPMFDLQRPQFVIRRLTD